MDPHRSQVWGLGMVLYSLKPKTTWEVETSRFLWVPGQPSSQLSVTPFLVELTTFPGLRGHQECTWCTDIQVGKMAMNELILLKMKRIHNCKKKKKYSQNAYLIKNSCAEHKELQQCKGEDSKETHEDLPPITVSGKLQTRNHGIPLHTLRSAKTRNTDSPNCCQRQGVQELSLTGCSNTCWSRHFGKCLDFKKVTTLL